MCGFIVDVTLVFAGATVAPRIPYVQPRSRKIRSKTGIGIPSSQSRMYPVAPACLILLAKRIADTFVKFTDSKLFVVTGSCFD
jgi:hypothetical protein